MQDDTDAISFPYKDWEQVHSFPFESSSFSLPSSIQTHSCSEMEGLEETPSTGWEVVMRETQLSDDFSIFPPSNHEGLHIPFQTDHLQGREESVSESESEVEASTSSSSSFDTDEKGSKPLLYGSSLRIVGGVVKQLRFWLEFLSSNLFCIASSVRSRVINRGCWGTIWSASSAIGVAAALLSSLLYMGVRRWRRRIQLEKLDRVILLIQSQDEKITRLTQQIAEMNQLLIAHYKVPVHRKG